MTIVYIGSTATISGLEAGPATIRWTNKKNPAPPTPINPLKPKSAIIISAKIFIFSVALVILILL